MPSKAKQVYRYERDFEFAEYMQDAWPEHARRIMGARRSAPFVRISYPLVGFLFASVFAGGLSLVVTVLARQESLWNNPESANASRLQWIHSILEQAVPVMWTAAVIVVLLVLMACISAGLAKARELLFDAEKLEMTARVEYMLGGVRASASDLDEQLPDEVAASPDAKKSETMDIPMSEF